MFSRNSLACSTQLDTVHVLARESQKLAARANARILVSAIQLAKWVRPLRSFDWTARIALTAWFWIRSLPCAVAWGNIQTEDLSAKANVFAHSPIQRPGRDDCSNIFSITEQQGNRRFGYNARAPQLVPIRSGGCSPTAQRCSYDKDTMIITSHCTTSIFSSMQPRTDPPKLMVKNPGQATYTLQCTEVQHR